MSGGEKRVRASVPEPPPVERGVPVTPVLVGFLRDRGAPAEVVVAVLARDAFGREKYGQPLMSEDGRDPVEDCRQELADGLQYAMRARMVGADLTPLLPFVTELRALIVDGAAPSFALATEHIHAGSQSVGWYLAGKSWLIEWGDDGEASAMCDGASVTLNAAFRAWTAAVWS